MAAAQVAPMGVGKILKEARIKLGFKSARAFFLEHLSKKATIEFGYAYYAKIEAEIVTPSSEVVLTIANTLPDSFSDKMILAYCTMLFPSKKLLFESAHAGFIANSKRAKKLKKQIDMPKQKYLSPRQVFMIGSSMIHYYLFLVSTLARSPLKIAELAVTLKAESIAKEIQDLKSVKLIEMEGGSFYSISHEMRFPPADRAEIKTIYRNIDLWNLDFPKHFNFEHPVEKMLIRRVSSKYIDLLYAQCNQLINLLKVSQETYAPANNEVMMLTLNLSQGRLPG